MTIATPELAQSLGLTEKELLHQSLQSFLQEKRREVLQARLEILSRYESQSLSEFEDRIRKGQIPEHPAWEDLITAENLGTRLEELDGYIRNL